MLTLTLFSHTGSVLGTPPILPSPPPPLRLRPSRFHSHPHAQTYPDLQPLYDAARSYLEIPQRIDLLNARVEVLQDMLQLLKETVTSRHAERLEQIVIALIAVEIGAFPPFPFPCLAFSAARVA